MTRKHHPILKKYQHLAARDLLYLQAELCDLDFKFNAIAKQDAQEEDERQYYDRDWQYLHSSQTRDFSGEQWEIALATRAKLREYCKYNPSLMPWTDLTFLQMQLYRSILRLHQSHSQRLLNEQCYMIGSKALLWVVVAAFLAVTLETLSSHPCMKSVTRMI